MEEKIRKCQRCGIPEDIPILVGNCIYRGLVNHHIIPKGKSGRDTKENRILICEVCHRELHTKNGKLNYKL